MWAKEIVSLSKLTCRLRFGHLLSPYLDKELNNRVAKKVASHLSSCMHCREEMERLRFASTAVTELEILPTRNSMMWAPVFRLAVLTESSRPKRFYSKKVAVPLPLAACLVFGFVVAMVFAMNEKPQASIPPGVTAPPAVAIKVVEVPVDRIVTRTIYLQSASASTKKRRNDRFGNAGGTEEKIAQNESTWQWQSSALKDFRPAENANFRVVKEPDR
jgi:hypothetical protein